jgi:predicted aspartyl protease
MRKSNFTLALTLLCLIALSEKGMAATSEYDAGVSDFGKKDYKSALNHFDNALKINPRNANAIYYKAVTLCQLGRGQEGQMQYGTLIKYFPGSPPAKNAEAALAVLNPRYLQLLKPPASPAPVSSSPSKDAAQAPGSIPETEDTMKTANDDIASLPKQSKIYFEKDGKNLQIDAFINGRPIKMLFDSGAENVALGKNHLAQLGLPPPQTAPIGHAFGVGDGGAQAIWGMRVTLKVGNIERKNFPITVQEDMPTKPLLGQTFFKAFEYEVDNGAKTITFVKKDLSAAAAQAADLNVIPFQREGNEIVVQVEVNGRSIPMYLDTGAEQIYFTADQARTCGLEIPDDAQTGMTQGIAGKQTVKSFVVPRMKCGPIIKNDVTIVVAQPSADSDSDGSSSHGKKREGLRHPLLGQEFFGDFRITVDNDANVIRMRR